jgi:hypothetical protein
MTKFKFISTLALSMCLMAASVTSASAFFHASEYPVKVIAKSTAAQLFKAQSNAVVECATGKFYSTGAGGADSSQLKITAIYEKCESKLAGGAGEPATVNMNQCNYNFHQAKGASEGQVSIECPKGASIVVSTNAGCTVKVGEATNGFLKNTKFRNLGTSPNTVEVTPEVEGITDEVNFVCNIGGIKANKEGKYSGTSVTEGRKTTGGGQVGVEVI